MYEKFYNLNEKPFNVTPDPRFLYLGEHHQEALAHLIYGISERKGFIVITGEVGTGKTTLIHTLLEKLEKNIQTALIFNPNLTIKDFFLSLLDEFDLKVKEPTKANFLFVLNNFLIERLKRNENAVLVIDEAQNLTPSLLEEIRLLLNLETSKDKLLQIVLAGQPELHQKLNQPELRQLKQRISVRYHIPPLNNKEVTKYINERLRVAGSQNSSIFTQNAIDEIFKYSRGIPRLINILCDNALLVGYATDQSKINNKVIKECIEDLELKKQNPQEMIEVGPRTPRYPFSSKEWGIALTLFIFLFLLAGSIWWYPEKSKKTGADFNGSISRNSGTKIEEKKIETPQTQPDNNLSLNSINKEGTSKEIALPKEKESLPEVLSPETAIKNISLPYPTGVEEPGYYREKTPDYSVDVNKNDWLSSIIFKRYGMVNSYIISLVLKANPNIKNMNHIEVGWKIFLPDLDNKYQVDDLFSVHVASFRKFSDARSLFSHLAQENYEAYLMPISISGKGHWYRVTLGRFKNEERALQYANRLLSTHKFQYAKPLHIAKVEVMDIEK